MSRCECVATRALGIGWRIRRSPRPCLPRHERGLRRVRGSTALLVILRYRGLCREGVQGQFRSIAATPGCLRTMIQTSCRRAGYRPVAGQVCGKPPTPLGGRRWQRRVRPRISRRGIPRGTPLSEATPGYLPLTPLLIRRDAFHRGQRDKESGRRAKQTGRNGQPPGPAQQQPNDQKHDSCRWAKQDSHGGGVRPRAGGTLRRESVAEAAMRHGRRQARLGR